MVRHKPAKFFSFVSVCCVSFDVLMIEMTLTSIKLGIKLEIPREVEGD